MIPMVSHLAFFSMPLCIGFRNSMSTIEEALLLKGQESDTSMIRCAEERVSRAASFFSLIRTRLIGKGGCRAVGRVLQGHR